MLFYVAFCEQYGRKHCSKQLMCSNQKASLISTLQMKIINILQMTAKLLLWLLRVALLVTCEKPQCSVMEQILETLNPLFQFLCFFLHLYPKAASR